MAARKSARKRSAGARESGGKEALLLDRDAIRHWRIQRGFTQQGLAQQRVQLDGQQMQISYAQLRRIEAQGRAGPATARILAALLGVELAQLQPRDSRQLACGLPREVSVDFVGRRAELDAVLAALGREGNVRIAASVEGLPGVGKTELALQVCGHAERTRAYRIFWFNAEDPDLTAQWAEVVADHLGLPQAEPRERARAAVRALDTLAEPVLIVLDNVERWSASEPWPRPQGRHIRWLVTTRASRLGERAFEHIEVPVLDEASAAELMLRIAGAQLAERPGLRALLAQLDGYTIAIELAAAFLARFPEVTPAEYLELLAEGKGDRFELEVKGHTAYEQTFEDALELLWRRLPAATRDAWALAACFAQEHASTELSDACGLARRLRAELRDFHLIQADARGWSMHRLVRGFALRRAVGLQIERAQAALVRGAVEHLSGREALTSAPVADLAHYLRALRIASDQFPDSEALAQLQQSVAEAYVVVGSVADSRTLLEQAAAFYRAQLARLGGEQPLERAHALARLARALSYANLWRARAEEIHEAIAVCREALQLYDASAPQWVSVQQMLGNGLEERFWFTGDVADLEASFQAYERALARCDREREPRRWYKLQLLLATDAQLLAHCTAPIGWAHESIRAHRIALQGLTRESFPFEWAGASGGLALALSVLCGRTGEVALADEAVQLARAALQIETREAAPLRWASTQGRLSSALRARAEASDGVEDFAAAAAALRAQLEVTLRESEPYNWAVCTANLGGIEYEIGRRTGSDAALQESLRCLQSSAEEFSAERFPENSAPIQAQLGAVRALLAQRRGERAGLAHELEHCRKAAGSLARERYPSAWVSAQLSLGRTLEVVGRELREPALLHEAIQCLRGIQDARSQSDFPRPWHWLQEQIEALQAHLAGSESDRLAPAL